MAMDWLNCSKQDRQDLYDVASSIRRDLKLSWSDIYERASLTYTPEAEKNFAKGQIAKDGARRIAQYISEQHLQRGLELAPHLFDPAWGDEWDRFLEKEGSFGQVVSVTLPSKSMGIVTFADREPIHDRAIKSGEHFCFKIDSPMEGQLIALQEYAGNWYPMLMTRSSIPCQVSMGHNTVPWDDKDDEVIPLSELTHMGKHGFAFLIVPEGFVETITKHMLPGHMMPKEFLLELARMVKSIDPKARAVLRLNVMFVL